MQPAIIDAAPRRLHSALQRTRQSHIAHASIRFMLAGLAIAYASAIAGCYAASPFGSNEYDTGRRVSVAKLQSAEPLDVQQYAKPLTDNPTADPSKLSSRLGERKSIDLSLETARAAVLENNLDLSVVLLDPTIANARLSKEEAAFESVFTLNTRWQDFDTPVAISTQSGEARVQSFTPGIRIPLKTGGRANITLPYSRTRTDNAFVVQNPSHRLNVEFSLAQELLRGAGRRANTHAIRLASYNSQISQAQSKLEVIRQIANADRAYWLLYGVRAELDVRMSQLELAETQLRQAERQHKAGRQAEVEVIRAQAGVSDRVEQIIIAENSVLRQQRLLKRLMNIPDLDIATKTLIVPTSPPDPVRYEYDTRALTEAAVANRMEMLELELQLAGDTSTIDFNRNQALPLFTLDFVYRWQGQGGTLNSAYSVLTDDRFNTFELGLNAEVPIGNERARSQVRESVLTRLRRLGSKEARALSIRTEVLDAVDQIEASWQRIVASQLSVLLNTRTFEAEQREFNVGRRTSTDVLNAASRLQDAQSSEIRAIVDYQIAQIDLAFSTGTLLGASRIDWEPINPATNNNSAIPWTQTNKPQPILDSSPNPKPDPS